MGNLNEKPEAEMVNPPPLTEQKPPPLTKAQEKTETTAEKTLEQKEEAAKKANPPPLTATNPPQVDKEQEKQVNNEQENSQSLSNRQKKAPDSKPLNDSSTIDDFDPLKALEEASFKFEGLPPLPKQQETANQQEEKKASEVDYSEKEDDYSNETTTKPPTPPEPSASTIKRMKTTSASTIVRQGDKAQAMLMQMLFNWRGSGGVNAATADRDKLIDKVTKGKELSESERKILAYAQKYIAEFDQRKQGFEEQSYLSEEDKNDLCALLEDYFEVMSYKPSPMFMILLIIGGTLFYNIYTAFTAHPSYNPPKA